MLTDTTGKAPVCKGCGKCCRNGGPALYTKDAFLFAEGLLQPRDLVTIRAGELVRDTDKERLTALPQELVKIAPSVDARPGDWACRFLTSRNTCSIHGKHPAECRALYCEAPEALLLLKDEPRLTREAICELVKAPAWWKELIEAHEEKTSYAVLTALAERLDADADARNEFAGIVEYDRVFREVAVKKNAAPADALDFLFGRPLLRTVAMYGLDARDDGDKIRLVKTV